MSIADTTTTTTTPYGDWDLDVLVTGAQTNRRTIDFARMGVPVGDEVLWAPDECDELFAESVALTKPTLWDKILQVTEALSRPAGVVEVLDEVTMLRRARHYLSLNTKELAEVMNVERPTIYAWLEGTKIRKANRARLEAIYSVAEIWWERSRAPLGSLLHARVTGGRSVFELLKQGDVNPVDVVGMFEHMATAPVSTVAVPARHDEGFAKVSATVQRATARRATRRMRR